MKKIVLYTSLSLSLVSISVYAIGLGDMRVMSQLKQPFRAQIKLLDIGNTPLSGIKANIASVEDYQRMGLDRVNAVGLLTFVVEKNTEGEPILNVYSSERISEPFMQVLVDLAWAEGQVYHSYTVLLDPPNYQLASQKKLLGHTGRDYSSKHEGYHQKSHELSPSSGQFHDVSYGPTSKGETIWQIAQRFKTEQNLLQQIILAIVGTNPQAFMEGNLNGLKPDIRLHIPSSIMVSTVPNNLAESEVLAHDKAWQTRQPIQHILMPPYMQTTTTTEAPAQNILSKELPSNLPPVPALLRTSMKEAISSNGLTQTTSLVSIGEAFGMKPTSVNPQPQLRMVKPINVKAEIDIAAAAIDSVHQANALLIEQMHTLLKENKRLKKQLSQSDHEIRKLRKNLLQVLERRGVAGQVNHLPAPHEQNSVWSLLMLLLLLGGGGVFIYWLFWIRPKEFLKDYKSESNHDLFNEPIEPEPEVKDVLSPEPMVEEAAFTQPVMIEAEETEPSLQEVEFFEPQETEGSPGLSLEETDAPEIIVEEKEKPVVKKIKAPRKSKAEKKPKEMPIDDNTLEFDPPLPSVSTQTPEEDLLADLSEIQSSDKQHKASEGENALEYVITPEEEPVSEEPAKPVKSSVALDTLLDLARTYMGMDDIESARQSLQEVMEFGNERQKKEAKALLDQL